MTEPGRDDDPLAGSSVAAAPLTASQKRTRTLITLLLVGGLGAGLALSTIRQTTPSGGTSNMGGMKMGSDDRIGIALRDIEGRPLNLPGGTPGAVMFMAANGCPGCADTARRLVRAAADVEPAPVLTLVSTDPVDTRADFRRFDRDAGGLPVRYALDDRSGSVAQQFGARENGAVVAYGRSGMIRDRIGPSPRPAAALERALHRRPD